MQVNKLNNIIFLKNVESNIIEEAFVVLKNNININNLEVNNKIQDRNQIDILKEAELLINTKIEESNIRYEKYKMKRLEEKYKKVRILNCVLAISSFIIFLITKYII